jgi:hypothetical protein
MADTDVEHLVPDPIGVTLMSIWRWDRDPAKHELGWPPKVQISGRNYRARSQLEVFKQNLVKRALAERGEAA